MLLKLEDGQRDKRGIVEITNNYLTHTRVCYNRMAISYISALITATQSLGKAISQQAGGGARTPLSRPPAAW